jgi:hypothetical protein
MAETVKVQTTFGLEVEVDEREFLDLYRQGLLALTEEQMRALGIATERE